MSRFTTPDLSSLGEIPALISVDFEEIRERRAAFLREALNEVGIDYDVTELQTSPLMIATARGGGYEEVHYRKAINEAIEKLSLATANDGDLDHIGATYYGISRQLDQNGEPVDNERQRDITHLAPEAFSTAGPLGAYVFHALELDGINDIADAWAYAEEDEAVYSNILHADAYSEGQRRTPFENREAGKKVLAPEVLAVIVPSVDYGQADAALMSRVYKALTSREVRPLGDNVRVELAEIIDYEVEMEIIYAPGADPEPLIAEATKKLEEYTAQRRRVGVTAQRVSIGGAGNVTDVEHINLISPTEDVGGGSKQAPNCTSITVTAVQSEGTWS